MKVYRFLIQLSVCATLCSCTDLPQDNANTAKTTDNEGAEEPTEEVVDIKVCKGAEKAITDLQSDTDNPESFSGAERLRIVSYNCENLYDTADDPNTNDDEFTPEGEKNWTKSKYKTKLINVAKAIKAAGNGTMPAIVGLAEVENKTVLNDLRNQDVLKAEGYRYVHKDGPDKRGIDVALLYSTSRMKLASQKWIPVRLSSKSRARDILYAKFQLKNNEMLHVFVNHWPSMREGEAVSEDKRVAAAKAVLHTIDSLRKAEDGANIVLMGDFNSTLSQAALANVLKVKQYNKSEGKGSLCDLTSRYDGNDNIGSHKYGGKWDVLDHMIVEGGMLNKNANVFTTPYSGHICHELFLLSQSSKGYYSPKRGFKGNTWTCGYSDHLPISLDLYIR